MTVYENNARASVPADPRVSPRCDPDRHSRRDSPPKSSTALIGLVTNLAFYQRISTELVSPLGSNSAAAADLRAGDRRPDHRPDGEIRHAAGARTRHPRSDGSRADEEKPHPAESRHPQAAQRRHLDWFRSALRRGRPDHPDRRGDWLAARADASHHHLRAQSAAGLRRCRRTVGHLRHADCRRDLRYRTAAVRIPHPLVYSAGRRQRDRLRGAYRAGQRQARFRRRCHQFRHAARTGAVPRPRPDLRRGRQRPDRACSTGSKTCFTTRRSTPISGPPSAGCSSASSAISSPS